MAVCKSWIGPRESTLGYGCKLPPSYKLVRLTDVREEKDAVVIFSPGPQHALYIYS